MIRVMKRKTPMLKKSLIRMASMMFPKNLKKALKVKMKGCSASQGLGKGSK